MAKRSRKEWRGNPAARLTDDLIVEILSRLPVKSLCRFKCVSQHWRGLISQPDHCRRLPRTLAGMFYTTWDHTRFPNEVRHFANLLELGHQPLVCPSLSLPGYERISRIVDSCNGLLLCRRSESPSTDGSFRYVVCNPATRSWVVLPDSGCGSQSRIGRSSLLTEFTGMWQGRRSIHAKLENGVTRRVNGTLELAYLWIQDLSSSMVFCISSSLSFTRRVNGTLELACLWIQDLSSSMVFCISSSLNPAPDDVGDTTGWEGGFLGRYQGHLCYIHECDYESGLSLWVLEDCAADEWILKHHVSIQKLCKKMMTSFRSKFYHVITVHPDCNLILYAAGLEDTIMTYDIDREEARAIRKLGSYCQLPYIPYVPFYSESLIHEH